VISGPWDLYASYTLGFTKGTVSDYFDGYLANPRFTSFEVHLFL
jgi:hypothetical protein